MRANQKGSNKAKEILDLIGYEDISDISMEDLMCGFDIIYKEENLHNSDGKIVRGKSRTLIKVDSAIISIQRKRFVATHELGHHFLHKKLELHNDNAKTLNWFKIEKQAQRGVQEYEANDFASELLMPENAFREFINKKPFSPQLIKDISQRFRTSLTSVIFRLLTLDIAPIFVVFIYNGCIHYWRKSDDLKVWVPDITKLSPPKDSVAKEYLDADYDFIYTGAEKAQLINKSTWFKLNDWEDDIDFYEYCIPTKQYKTIISLIWEA